MKQPIEKRYWIYAVTPVHVGAGRGLGYIDMPIAREKVTNWPYIPGSSVKGVIADYFGASEENRNDNSDENKKLKAAFGMSGADNESAAGAIVFTDANILCMPIRSFYGTFAWITSPFCLRRMNINISLNNSDAFVPAPSKLISGVFNVEGLAKIYLEDIDITVRRSDAAADIARRIAQSVFTKEDEWQKTFIDRFVIVDDDIFTFLCEFGTEVNAHIRIDENTGIVRDGALWYEEALPVETILTGKIWCDKSFVEGTSEENLIKAFCTEELNIQIGGKASTGKGQVCFVFEKLERAGE